MSSTTRHAVRPDSTSIDRTTTASATPRGTRVARRSTIGCRSPANVAATSTQPMTRADAEIIASVAIASASIATATTIERVLTWSRVRCGSATAAYRTGMPAAERGADVLDVDLDWRSVAV